MKLKNFISCVCYLFLISCQEENFSPVAPCCKMYFSSAQPLEFWINGCQTFNEKSVFGAHDACYCQKFNCDDPIRIQFTDDDQDDDFLIVIYDEDGNELFSDTPDKTDLLNDDDAYVKSVYDYVFTPSQTSPDLCNRRIVIKNYSVADLVNYRGKTDCIDIKENHAGTQLIKYTQERNYAGLIYQNNSPNIDFYFRVSAVFFRQRFPKTQESMNLSQGVLNLNSTIKIQRLFGTDYLPAYEHKKLNLILSHQYVEIDNQTWVAEEEYELVETNRMRLVQKGQIWLTESDFLARNVI